MIPIVHGAKAFLLEILNDEVDVLVDTGAQTLRPVVDEGISEVAEASFGNPDQSIQRTRPKVDASFAATTETVKTVGHAVINETIEVIFEPIEQAAQMIDNSFA